MAIAAKLKLTDPNFAVPDLFIHFFPSWFEGFAFAAIGVGALVPAAIMSIAAANLFTRNIYRPYVRPGVTDREEATVAKLTSLVVKVGALLFALFVPTKSAIDLQLLGGVWIIQTLPAVLVGLYTRWFHRWALVAGWAVGMGTGTAMAASQNFKSAYPLDFIGIKLTMYSAFFALLANLVVTTSSRRCCAAPSGGSPRTRPRPRTTSTSARRRGPPAAARAGLERGGRSCGARAQPAAVTSFANASNAST